jgi:hypothetical protein
MATKRQPEGSGCDDRVTGDPALGPNQLIWDSGKGAAAGFGGRRRTEIAVRYILKYAPRMAGSGGT